MPDAVIVSYARTGLAKSMRGGFNNTHGAAMGGHAVKHAMARAKIDPAEVEDVVMGCGNPEGATGHNTGRDAALWAGCPVTTSGTTINRFCSSGLNAIAVAANYVKNDGAKVAVGAGVESISLVQFGGRYGVSREAQDEYALRSQKLIAAAQANGVFKDEIVPMKTKMKVVDKATGAESFVDYEVTRDECNRPETTLEALQG